MLNQLKFFFCSTELNLNERDGSGFAAMHYAVKAGSPEAIQILIDNGADKDVRSTLETDLLTPALLAVVEDQVDCLAKLMENRADLNAESTKDYPSHYQNQRIEDYGVLAMCVVHDRIKCLELLMSQDEDAWKSLEKAENNVHGTMRATTMGLAVKFNSTECLKMLLKDGCSPGSGVHDVSHAFCQAAENGSTECLDVLLKHNMHKDVVDNVNFSTVEQRALLFTVLRNDEQMLKTLTEYGFRVRPWPGNQSALHAAAGQGSVNCLNFVLEQDGFQEDNEIKAIDWYRRSPLWYAANRGHPECVERLIRAGAWPNTFDEAMDIIKGINEHRHICLECQMDLQCTCYGTKNYCQINHVDHTLPGQSCIYEDTWEPDCCTKECNCKIGETIKILSIHAINMYGEDNEVGQKCISYILNKAMHACFFKDQPDTLRWVLSQGATPFEFVYSELNGIARPLFAAAEAHAEKCFDVLLEYGRSFLPEKAPISKEHVNTPQPVGSPAQWAMYSFRIETILYFVIANGLWDTKYYVKRLHDIGVDLNERLHTPSRHRVSPIILQAIKSHNFSVAKLMISLGVSATLRPGEEITIEPPYHSQELDQMFNQAKVLLAAGFDRSKVLTNFNPNIPWLQSGIYRMLNTPIPEEDQDRINKFVADNTRNRSLEELCRDAIGEHLMSIHPNTNLFHLMPQIADLLLPRNAIWMKDFLLSGIEL